MKFNKTIMICILVAAGVVMAGSVDAAYHKFSADEVNVCNAPQEWSSIWTDDYVCYTVKSGDTLWGISERFYGDGAQWKTLAVNVMARSNKHVTEYLSDPRLLQIGTKIVFNNRLIEPYPGYALVYGDVAQNPETGELLTISGSGTRPGGLVIHSGDELYDGPYPYIWRMRMSPDRSMLTYFVDTKPSRQSGCPNNYHGYQLVLNKVANEHYSCGRDFKLFSFSPNNNHYILRNNTGSDPEKFIVLSDLGNSQEYDYIDELQWINDDTFVYRAQIDDVWRVVVNNEEWGVHEYLRDIKEREGDGGVWSYEVRNADGSYYKEILHQK